MGGLLGNLRRIEGLIHLFARHAQRQSSCRLAAAGTGCAVAPFSRGNDVFREPDLLGSRLAVRQIDMGDAVSGLIEEQQLVTSAEHVAEIVL